MKMNFSKLKKFLSRIKDLFPKDEFSLYLVGFETKPKKDDLHAVFRVTGDIQPLTIRTVDIISSISKYSTNMSSDNILEVLRAHDSYWCSKDEVEITAVMNKNRYIVKYSGESITITGDEICQDMSILRKLDIDKAYRIIYDTAYLKGISDFKSSSKAGHNKKPGLCVVK